MIRRPNGVTFTFAAVTASRDEKDFQSNRQTAEVVSRRQPHLIIFRIPISLPLFSSFKSR